jgi:hypothetical protein
MSIHIQDLLVSAFSCMSLATSRSFLTLVGLFGLSSRSSERFLVYVLSYVIEMVSMALSSLVQM